MSGQLNMEQVGEFQYDGCSDIWGYAGPDGREYAIVGLFNGVSILDLDDPANPVEAAFLPGVGSGWRDIKTWGEYAYVINETGNGLMVIDLRDLPNSATAVDWAPTIDNLGTLSSCHNIWIDEFGFAYLAGCTLNSGGLLFVDVATTPGEPIFVAAGESEYSHDVYVRENICYSSEINAGVFSIYDVTDKENYETLGSQSTDFNFTHNAWLNDEGNVLFTTDEVANAPVGSYDVSDPNDIQLLDLYKPYETLGDGVIPHNVHVWNDWIIISYYTDGCIVVDGSRPTNLVEVGNFDTFVAGGTGFNGAWGAYPYLPSGLVLTSNIDGAVNILAPTYVRACWLEGGVSDADSGLSINGASIKIIDTNVDEKTNAAGAFATGFATAGTYMVEASKPGYESQVLSADLANGVVTELSFELTPLPSFNVTGQVIDASTGEGVADAQVLIINDGFTYEGTSGDGGEFDFSMFFDGNYRVSAGKWGYKTSVIDEYLFDEETNTIFIELDEGIEDIFSLDLGWNVVSPAVSGDWERGVPIGVNPQGFFITPNEDVPQDPGNQCYITGNTDDLFSGVVLGGSTRLESPVFDLSNYTDPHMNYYAWWISVNLNTYGAGDGEFEVLLSNGNTFEVIDTLSYPELAAPEWEFRSIKVSDFIEPTDNMQITFQANAAADFSTIGEAGVDFFSVTDGPLSDVTDLDILNVGLVISPNPSQDIFNVEYDFTEANVTDPRLEVYDQIGRKLISSKITDVQGKLEIGAGLNAGFYLVVIRDGAKIAQLQKIIKQ